MQAHAQLLHQLAADFRAQLLGFLVGADQVVGVVHVDLLHFQAVAEQAQVAAANLVVEAAAQGVLGTARRAGVAGGALPFVLVDQHQPVGSAAVHAHAAVFQHAAHVLDGLAVGVACGEIQFGQGKIVAAGAAQLKAAGAEQGGQHHQQQAGQATFHQASLM
ncbi:hypothetical protein D3C80_1496850 [compost metagenome]